MRFWIFWILCIQLYANPFDRVRSSSSEEIASLASNLLIDGYVSSLSGQLVLSETDLHVQSAQDLLLTRSYVAPQILEGYAKDPKLDRLLLGEALLQLHTKGWVVFPHLWAGYNLHSPYFQLRDPQGFVLEFAIENNQGVLKTSSYGCTNLQEDTPSSFIDLRNIKLTLDGPCVHVLYPNGLSYFFASFPIKRSLFFRVILSRLNA